MALFSRKDKTAEIVKAVAEEIQKSLAGTPMANSGYANSTAANPYTGMGGQGLIQVQGESVPMRRWGQDFGSMLGPAAPLLPAPIDPVLDDSGRPIPRKYEYQIAVNLNLTQTEVPFQVLKSLTEQCDIIHRCIEIRISEIVKQRWSFSVSDDAIATIMEEQNVSHAKASKIGREKYGKDILRLTQFWENPYVHNDRGWVEWITEALWQHFAFDQVCVYPRYNFKKKIIGFDVIDAPTIKILLDNRGDIPYPPAPAYQQILWGFPRGEFTSSPEADGEFYTGPGRGDQFLTDQMSVFVKNRRTWSPYGFSAVEECIPAATLYLERQTWMRDEYQAGSTPKTWMETNSQELDHLKLAAFERVLNDKLTGSSQERHRVKVLPEGFHPVEMKSIAADYKSDYDEFIIKRIGSAFGVSPSQLGVIARAGMGGGKGAQEGESDNAETVSKKPMENFIIEMVNSLCRRYLGTDRNITFILNDQESGKDAEAKAQSFQTSLYSGQLTMNDVRGEIGMPLYDMPEADEPMIVAGSTIQFLKGMLDTDGAGETVGQKENPLDETSAQPEGLAEEEAKPQVPEVQAETLEESKSAEARAYKRFVSKPRARDFVFQFHTPDEVETLKAQISDTPKGPHSFIELAKEFNPDQPRDDHGRFGEGGSAGSNSATRGTGASFGRPDVGNYQLSEKESEHLYDVYHNAGKETKHQEWSPVYEIAGQNAIQVEMAKMLGMDGAATIENDPGGRMDNGERPSLFRGCDKSGADSLTENLTSYGGSGGTLIGSGVYTSPNVSVANEFAKEGGYRVDCWVAPDANIATASNDRLASNFGFKGIPDEMHSSWSKEALSGNFLIMETPCGAALSNGYQGLDATAITGQQATVIFDRSVMSVNVSSVG